MDLDDAAEELYAGSPDDFVERRTALVAQARAARDRPLAKEIGALRRPTRTAWLLNRLARDDAAGVEALLALAGQLEDAQRRGSGPDLRRLSAERRTLVDRLARDAVRRGTEAGYAAAESALQEVGQSLQSALGDPGTAEQLRRGRLTTAVSYAGFGSTDLLAAMAASLPAAAAPEPEPEVAAAPEPAAEPEPEPEPEADPSRAGAGARGRPGGGGPPRAGDRGRERLGAGRCRRWWRPSGRRRRRRPGPTRWPTASRSCRPSWPGWRPTRPRPAARPGPPAGRTRRRPGRRRRPSGPGTTPGPRSGADRPGGRRRGSGLAPVVGS